MFLDKAAIRSKMIAKRSAMPASQAKELSRKICSRVTGIPAIKDSESIGIYISFRNEVLAEMLLASLTAMGKKVFAPVVLNNDRMEFVRLKSLKDTKTGRAGMREPVPKVFAREGSIGVFVVPGVAFDLRGFRVGWGRGHYDRFLSDNGGTAKIGVAYDFQIVGKIDAKPHDVRMDFVATERRLLKF